MEIFAKRIYDDPAKSDGFRILADRLWPRGMTKEKAEIDLWAKDIAPSTELRKSYHGKEIDFKEFSEKYLKELTENPQTEEFLNEIKKHKTVTLMTSVKEIEGSEVPVLKEFILLAETESQKKRFR
ncbi:MAG: DUF488 family protein [Weeksellaceae bacterium]|nr:DUF488 family protein [Bacteroidota bacterium]MCG2780531.1 DUF488 family protein [Weeksellaceae bacterium]